MPSNLSGARIILTGASFGIGEALARELARCQARLVLAARSMERLEVLAKELEASGVDVLTVATDITDPAQRERLLDEAVAKLGGIDVLINNAGVGATGNFHEASEERLRRVFEINFFGTAELTRLAIPHLKAGQRPMVVNVSSVIGRRAIPGYSEYCASKFAVCGWSEALRGELAPLGIHVLLVNPGLIETPFREHLVEDRLQSQGRRPKAMGAQRCAQIIVRAMERRKNELVITFSGKLLLWVNRLAPRFVDRMMQRYGRNAMSKGADAQVAARNS